MVHQAHSRESHLQYLLSLEADMADAAQDEGDVTEKSVASSTIDTGDPIPNIAVHSCWEIEQTEHPGKYHIICHRRIHHIIYDIIYYVHIIYDITYERLKIQKIDKLETLVIKKRAPLSPKPR